MMIITSMMMMMIITATKRDNILTARQVFKLQVQYRSYMSTSKRSKGYDVTVTNCCAGVELKQL